MIFLTGCGPRPGHHHKARVEPHAIFVSLLRSSYASRIGIADGLAIAQLTTQNSNQAVVRYVLTLLGDNAYITAMLRWLLGTTISSSAA